MSDWWKELSIGTVVDLQDSYRGSTKWLMGVVKEINQNESKLKVSFFGWHEKWAQWINTASAADLNRLAPVHTHTIPCIFNPSPTITSNSTIKSFVLQNNNCILCIPWGNQQQIDFSDNGCREWIRRRRNVHNFVHGSCCQQMAIFKNIGSIWWLFVDVVSI